MVNHPKIAEIIASGKLPSPKGIAAEVIRLTQKDDATNQEIAHFIKSDPALSSLIIKVANSRVTAKTRPIASIVDAVSVLGFSTIRQLVLGLSLLESNRDGACIEFNYHDFWARSLLTAITAQNLVLKSGIGAPEEVFILGLLGQIGILALVTTMPKEYIRILKMLAKDEGADMVNLECAEFGFDHNQLTQAMLADWGLPQVFQDIVFHHENPPLSNLTEGSRGWHLVHVLHIAAYFSKMGLAQEPLQRKMIPKLVLMASRLGIELNNLAEIGDKSVSEWRDWRKLCGIKSADIPPFLELFKAVPLVPSMLDSDYELPIWAGAFYKMRILLVDDDKATLLLQKMLLEKSGHTVVTAGDGEEGLSVTEKFKPQLIITDWLMPKMDGLEFCKALRRNPAYRNIYIFIMTAQEGVDRLVEAFEAGANDYITKPVNHKVLLARLRAGQRVVQLQEEMEFDRQQLHKFADEVTVFNHRLRKSEAGMRAILDNAPYIAWLKDAEGRYLKVNKTFVDAAHKDEAIQIIGKTDFDLWPQEAAEKYRADDAEVMTSRQPKRTEEQAIDGGKTYWIESFKTPVIDEHGKILGTTGFARDITERIQQEEIRLADVRKQRDVLVREVHHRIKNNLQGVVGLLQQHGIDYPELKDIIKTIIGRIYSIAIIHGLQAQGTREEVELGTLIKNIAEASGVRFDIKSDLKQPVRLNREEAVPIALILNELCTNACKHRAKNSQPVIRMKMRGTDTVITIVNDTDVSQPDSTGGGQGLKLIKSLLPSESTSLSVERAGNRYMAELIISPPVTML